ncbi:glycosyltransferase [Candidatus Gottesmanbacteria bacterium]|nr:glycosyltransferase [Candidatus Gottesmanbacteria bacterium]
MKVALAYDRVNKIGGAERVLLALHEIWPKAPLYTAVYDEEKAPWAKVFPKVITSFLQKIPLAKSHHELFAALTELAFETFNFSQFDLVISVTSSEAKAIITKPETLHICFCLTPTRYLWSGNSLYQNNPGFGVLNPMIKTLLPLVVPKLRVFDQIASKRPDFYLAISNTVKKRIKKYYQRESEVVYPGIDTDKFKIQNSKFKSTNQKSKVNYFLVVSRLVPYKRIDLAIEAFNELGWELKIIGTGVEADNLKKIAKSNVEFLGELTDEKLVGYYQDCRALVCTQEEDFGLVSIEAQAFGKPVIAFAKGGIAETIRQGKTGILFKQQNLLSLFLALKKFTKMKFSSQDCRKNALIYNKEQFQKDFKQKVNKLWDQYQNITSV